jgi:hypothetical protein
MKEEQKKDPRTHTIIGIAMEVHRLMGPGYLEAVYQECLEIEFELKGITFNSKPQLICKNCGIEMEFWFSRYGPDIRVLKHFGLDASERIPVKQFALKSAEYAEN